LSLGKSNSVPVITLFRLKSQKINKNTLFRGSPLVACENPQFKGKGKAVPLQAWTDPEGSRKLRFPDFITTAQDGGKVVSLTHRPPLPPGNALGTHFC